MTQTIDVIGGEYRNRTGLDGFAIRCITYLPTRLAGRFSKQPAARGQAPTRHSMLKMFREHYFRS